MLFIIYTVFWLATALVTASKGFESVSGFDGRLCLLVIGLLGAFYAALGGMRAVIWTGPVPLRKRTSGNGVLVRRKGVSTCAAALPYVAGLLVVIPAGRLKC